MTRYRKKNQFWGGYSSKIEWKKAIKKYRGSQQINKMNRRYKKMAFDMYHKKFRSGKRAFWYVVNIGTCKELTAEEQIQLYNELEDLRKK